MIKEGNFLINSCWCDLSCALGHEVRIINIGRAHYGVCDECKTYIFLGSNLTGSWREENKEIWKKNQQELKRYTLIEDKKSKNHCRKCGIEMKFDITNPLDLCDGCQEDMDKHRY